MENGYHPSYISAVKSFSRLKNWDKKLFCEISKIFSESIPNRFLSLANQIASISADQIGFLFLDFFFENEILKLRAS